MKFHHHSATTRQAARSEDSAIATLLANNLKKRNGHHSSLRTDESACGSNLGSSPRRKPMEDHGAANVQLPVNDSSKASVIETRGAEQTTVGDDPQPCVTPSDTTPAASQSSAKSRTERTLRFMKKKGPKIAGAAVTIGMFVLNVVSYCC